MGKLLLIVVELSNSCHYEGFSPWQSRGFGTKSYY
jgi:hypothetical protein